MEVYYGLIAEKVEYPDDYTWIIFHLNPRARHQDGKPITADDVVFSFNKFLERGRAPVQAVLPGRQQGRRPWTPGGCASPFRKADASWWSPWAG